MNTQTVLTPADYKSGNVIYIPLRKGEVIGLMAMAGGRFRSIAAYPVPVTMSGLASGGQ
jgi:hypothetical protein